MIFGMSISTFTLLHVIMSLVGIAAGGIVVSGMLASKKLEGWTALFLATTVLTSATGFMFSRDHILPSHVVGVISLVVLALAIFALYFRKLASHWRWIYRSGGGSGPLPECVRCGFPGVFEIAGIDCTGADAIRTALRSRSDRSARRICRTDYPGSEIVSSSTRLARAVDIVAVAAKDA